MMGSAKPGPTARKAASASIERFDSRGQNCFGKLFREIGHRRVPAPPERMTGIILLSDCVIPINYLIFEISEQPAWR
jgi:hypothetical protein